MVLRRLLLLSLGIMVLASQAQEPMYKLGRPPTRAEIDAWDIAINPGDGRELPVGSGSPQEGEKLYTMRCLACHGPEGAGAVGPRLAGKKSMGSDWPFATSIWDYINRAMPLNQEGSLSADEVYALTAYLLYKNNIITEADVINAENLARIEMPNRLGYVPPPIDRWEPGMPRPFRIIEP